MCAYMTAEVPIPREIFIEVLEELKKRFKEYNRAIASSGYYLKPIHYAVKNVGGERRRYAYLGRYWWRVNYLGRTSEGKAVLKWTYIGKEKPRGLQEPPENPLDGISIYTKMGNEGVYFIVQKKGEDALEKIERILGKKITR